MIVLISEPVQVQFCHDWARAILTRNLSSSESTIRIHAGYLAISKLPRDASKQRKRVYKSLSLASQAIRREPLLSKSDLTCVELWAVRARSREKSRWTRRYSCRQRSAICPSWWWLEPCECGLKYCINYHMNQSGLKRLSWDNCHLRVSAGLLCTCQESHIHYQAFVKPTSWRRTLSKSESPSIGVNPVAWTISFTRVVVIFLQKSIENNRVVLKWSRLSTRYSEIVNLENRRRGNYAPKCITYYLYVAGMA